jgi:hypothetical protein
MRKLIVILTLLFAAAASAQEAPKNVKLLTGLSPLQLQRAMNLMRAGLGVGCDFCHVRNGEHGWDFASDAKEEKLQGREMIQLVMDLNAKYFKGRPAVTCNTCHNGHPRPALTVSLPVPPPQPPATPPVDRSKFPKAAELVAKYVAAAGEAPKGTTRVVKGSRIGVDGKSAPLEVYQSGNDIQIISTAPDGTQVTQTLTGDGGWVRDKDGVHPMRASMVENLRELSGMFELWSPASLGEKARVVGKDTIDGHDVWIVADGPTRLSFDATTGLLLRRLVLRDTPIGRRPEQTDFSDYRAVGKAQVPFTTRISLVDPWVGNTRKIDELQIGATVDPGRFTMPPVTPPPPTP